MRPPRTSPAVRRTPFLRAASRTAAIVPAAMLAFAMLLLAPAHAEETPPPPTADETAESRWETLRAHYFGDAEIVPGESLLALDAPGRALDAAVVPVAVRVLEPDADIRRLHLIVDQNPLPLAGIFTFEEEAKGWRMLETRIRLNEYTNVRAIAERADGSLAMVSRFVKASGGCSAPAMGDLDAAIARAGRMKLLIDEATRSARVETEGASPLIAERAADPIADPIASPVTDPVADAGAPLTMATIKISHPNNSGMQFDQISRHYIPAFFVERIGAEVDGRALLDIETNFSMSENPVVTLSFPKSSPAARTTLDVYALDSKGNRYESTAAFDAGS